MGGLGFRYAVATLTPPVFSIRSQNPALYLTVEPANSRALSPRIVEGGIARTPARRGGPNFQAQAQEPANQPIPMWFHLGIPFQHNQRIQQFHTDR